ncbi:MAG: sialidase family protein [Pseudomonadota bacterium]
MATLLTLIRLGASLLAAVLLGTFSSSTLAQLSSEDWLLSHGSAEANGKVRLIGAASRGVLQNMEVAVYELDPAAAGGLGQKVDDGFTDDRGTFQGVALVAPGMNDLYVVAVRRTRDSTNATTAKRPLLSEIRTVVSGRQILQKERIYATPISTLILSVALEVQGKHQTFAAALYAAEVVVGSIFGLGEADQLNLLTGAPLLTGAAKTEIEQGQVWQHRAIVEVFFSALHDQFSSLPKGTGTIDDLLGAMAWDLADGKLNARRKRSRSEVYDDESLASYRRPAETYGFARTGGKRLSDLQQIMLDELPVTREKVNVSQFEALSLVVSAPAFVLNGDTDRDGIQNSEDGDDDGDGYFDDVDAFPLDKRENADFDGDGQGDEADADDDNDGVADTFDELHMIGLPTTLRPSESVSVRAKAGPAFPLEVDGNEGWQLRHSLRDLSGNFQTVLNSGIPDWDWQGRYWPFEVVAPAAKKTYTFELSIRCSQRGGAGSPCADIDGEEITFTQQLIVDCPASGCSTGGGGNKNPDTRIKGATASVSGPGTLFQTRRGELYTVFSERNTRGIFTRIVRSQDRGETWERVPLLLEEGGYRGRFLETSTGELVYVSTCLTDDGHRICIYRSFNGEDWSVSTTSAPVPRFPEGPFAFGWNVIGLVDTPFGVTLFLRFLPDQSFDMNGGIWVSRSRDLIQWTSPRLITPPAERAVVGTAAYDGGRGHMLVYRPTTGRNETVLLQSFDGISWAELDRLALGPGERQDGIKFVRDTSGLYYTYYDHPDANYVREIGDDGTIGEPQALTYPFFISTNLVKLERGEYGLVYSKRSPSQTKIFFRTLSDEPLGD